MCQTPQLSSLCFFWSRFQCALGIEPYVALYLHYTLTGIITLSPGSLALCVMCSPDFRQRRDVPESACSWCCRYTLGTLALVAWASWWYLCVCCVGVAGLLGAFARRRAVGPRVSFPDLSSLSPCFLCTITASNTSLACAPSFSHLSCWNCVPALRGVFQRPPAFSSIQTLVLVDLETARRVDVFDQRRACFGV